MFILQILINSGATIIVDEDEDVFQAFERTLVNGGTVKINEDVHSIEDLIDEAKEEELKDSNDEEKEL